MALERGGNSYRGLGIHVSAWVMGQFEIFCPGYGSCFVNFALVMGCFTEICHSYGKVFTIYSYY